MNISGSKTSTACSPFTHIMNSGADYQLIKTYLHAVFLHNTVYDLKMILPWCMIYKLMHFDVCITQSAPCMWFSDMVSLLVSAPGTLVM